MAQLAQNESKARQDCRSAPHLGHLLQGEGEKERARCDFNAMSEQTPIADRLGEAFPRNGLLHLLAGPNGLAALHGLLRADGFDVGTDRWQNVYDLLLALQMRGQREDVPRGLRPMLAPLLCRTPAEQQRFGELFDLWCAGLDGAPKKQVRSVPAVTAEPLPRPRWRRIGWRLPAAVALVLMLAAGASLWWYQTRPAPIPETRALPKQQPRIIGGGEITKRPELAPRLLPPRRPLERPQLNIVNRWLLDGAGWAIAVPPLLLVLPPLALAWIGYGQVLRRRRTRGSRPLHRITLDVDQDDLFDAPPLREALRRLHRPVTVPTRRLDADASARRTARNGGLFEPVLRSRRRVPDIVALMEHGGGADQLAAAAAQGLDRLAEAGLTVIRYQYRGDPRRLIAADGRRLGLGDLVRRHAGARLLIIGDLAGFIDPFSLSPRPWLRELEPIGRRGLLGTRGVPATWRQVLNDQGFFVAELGSAGLEQAAAWFGPTGTELPPDGPGAAPLPGALRDADRWLQARPAADLRRLDEALDAFLQPDGRLLLAAMAAYPQLHWGLTRALDLGLFRGALPAARERRLLDLARLPWCRAGRLPDWLRCHLFDRLSVDRRERIAACYQWLLSEAQIDGHGRVRLPVDLPESGKVRENLIHWLRRDRTLAEPGDPLRDRVFAELLLGRRAGRLDLRLPSDLARHLGPRLAAWLPRTALALALAAVAGGLLQLAWSHWGSKPFGDWLIERQLTPNATIYVDIRHTADAHASAEALAETLGRWRFKVSIEPRELSMTDAVREAVQAAEASDVTRPRPINAVQWGSEADEPAAREIVERLTRLLWGQAPNKVPPGAELPVTGPDLPGSLPAGGIRVLLLTPASGRTGFRFDDRLSDDAGPVPLDGDRSFQDRLKDGGRGPEMMPLPGGTFLMGSPDGAGDADEHPQHAVSIRPFAIGRTEVTFDDYDRFAEATGRETPDDVRWGRGDRPVINVSWEDAVAYAGWLSDQTGQRYRLPSEAEWEYAARAGTRTAFWTGDCIDTDQANYDGNYDYQDCGAKTGVYRSETVPVGSLPANAFGLHEVAGNVWEWVRDCWNDGYDGAPDDGSAWESGDCARRVVRGGGWDGEPVNIRSAFRFRFTPDVAYGYLGFRLARAL